MRIKKVRKSLWIFGFAVFTHSASEVSQGDGSLLERPGRPASPVDLPALCRHDTPGSVRCHGIRLIRHARSEAK
jgi:hypothetical protein